LTEAPSVSRAGLLAHGETNLFADQLATSIEHAAYTDIDNLSQTVWKAWGTGLLDDDDAQRFAEALAVRKTMQKVCQIGKLKAPPKPKPQRSPDKQRSIERRRRLAKAAPIPPEYVGTFTVGEAAAVTIIAGEIARKGTCGLCLAAIAARAGTCKDVVRSAVRKAQAIGLWLSTERRFAGQVSLPNLIRPVSKPWTAYLRRWVGSKKTDSTGTEDSNHRSSAPVEPSKGASEGEWGAWTAARGSPPI
jgi:hypothetical protein